MSPSARSRDIEAPDLEALCRRTKVAALYLVPTNDNPTTTTLKADERLAIAAEILPRTSYASHPCGYHLWVSLGAGGNAAQVSGALADAGMTAIPADSFSPGYTSAPALRVSLGGTIEASGLRRGLTMLSIFLSSTGSRSRVI